MSFDIIDLGALSLGSARGRKPAEHGFAVVRELTEADIPLLLMPEALGSKTPAVQKMRQSHHALARLLAEGRKGVECSAILGISQSRISILRQDPAFQELVEFYSKQKDEIYLDVHQRLAGLAVDTLEEIHERLGEDPDSFSNKELLMVAEMALDRSVAPPKKAESEAGGAGGGVPAISITFVQGTNSGSEPLPPPSHQDAPLRQRDVVDLEFVVGGGGGEE